MKETAEKVILEVIETLKESTKSEQFKETTAYIEHPERIFSLENFSTDKVKCGFYYGDSDIYKRNVNIHDIYMASMYNGLNVIEFCNGILFIFSPKGPGFEDELPAIVFSLDDKCEEGIEVYGEILFVGFDWQTNSFRDLTKSDFAKIKSLIR